MTQDETNESTTDQGDEAGKLPGWTLLVSLLGWVISLMFLMVCRDFGLSLWIGVPAALVVIVTGSLADVFIERKYVPSRHSN